HLGRDATGANRVRGQQGAVANQIDQTWNPARPAVYLSQRLRHEADRLPAAGDRQTMRDVRRDRFFVERLQLVPNGAALVELPQLRRSQQRLQVQLSDEDDLQQLFLVGLEIRQDPDLLEHRQRQVLRFVDDEHRTRLDRNQRQQKVVQRVDQLLFADVRQPS